MHMPVAVPDLRVGDLPHSLPQIASWIFAAAVILIASGLLDKATGPLLADTVVARHVAHSVSLQRGPPHFLRRRPAG
jgi:hypothetical protein